MRTRVRYAFVTVLSALWLTPLLALADAAVLFDLKDETVTKMKFYAVIGQSPFALRKEWLRAKLTGSGNPPTAVMTEEEVVKMKRKIEILLIEE